tara:strand:- start:189 stop:590 length:402 start_codon:yes stop_codon:yes gene_type:complete
MEIYNYDNMNFINKGIEMSHLETYYDMVIHCHPWNGIPDLYKKYEFIANKMKPKYFILQTYGKKDDKHPVEKHLINLQYGIYERTIEIFKLHNYSKCLQIDNLDINKLYFENKAPNYFIKNIWNQTIIAMKLN